MNKKPKFSYSRRSFISTGVKAAVLVPFSGLPLSGIAYANQTNIKLINEGTQALDILILGGTSFLGPHQIAYALKRGHRITTFTRGKTKPTVHEDVFSKVEQLTGDRENNLEALKGRKWDAVIDNSGRKLEWTRATAELLKEHVGHYMYTSSVSVYYPYYKDNMKENEPLVLKVPENVEDDDEKYTYDYGVMKANSEIVARSIFGEDRSIIIRPTFMMGPADRTNRFMYWPTQLAKDGEVIIPGKASDPVQFIDVRDIAEWMIRLLENKTTGTFNAAGPGTSMGIEEFVHKAHAKFDSKVNFVNIDNYEFLRSQNLFFQAPWILQSEKYYGMSRVNIDGAIGSGLTYRPLANSMFDTYNWWYSKGVSQERRATFDADPNELHNRQGAILQQWRTFKN